MKFRRTFQSDTSDLSSKDIASFWEEQGYTVQKVSNEKITGKRGHILHNLYTLNVKKVATTITIIKGDETIDVSVNVNRFGQILTKADRMLFKLEFDMFGAFLKHEPFDANIIKQYKKFRNGTLTALIAITFTLGVLIGWIAAIIW